MADDRTYIRVHDGIDENHKIEGLSDAAFRLLISSWAYCSRNLNDGRITDAAWRKRGTPKARRELIDGNLAEQQDGYVQMHDYLEHQRSAAEVAELKRKRAEAGARGGKAKANALASAKQMPEQTASKTLPSTEAETDTDKEPSVEGGSLVRSGSPMGTPPRFPDHCKRHADVAEPGPCGPCADARKARDVRPALALVSPARRCLVHDETYTHVCRGCRADEIAAEETA